MSPGARTTHPRPRRLKSPTPRSYATAVLSLLLLVLMGIGGGESTPPPQGTTKPTEVATPNQGDDHDPDAEAHHDLLMEALKGKGKGGGAGRTAIVIASITTLGGIVVAVITMRRPKREEHRPR